MQNLFTRALFAVPKVLGLTIWTIAFRKQGKPKVTLSKTGLVMSIVMFVVQMYYVRLEIMKDLDKLHSLKIRTIGKAFFKSIGYLKLPVTFMPVWYLCRSNKKMYEKFLKACEIVHELDGNIKVPQKFLLKRFIPMILIYFIVFSVIPIAPNLDLKNGDIRTVTYYISRFMPHICGLLGIMQMVMLLGCVGKLMHQVRLLLQSLEN